MKNRPHIGPTVHQHQRADTPTAAARERDALRRRAMLLVNAKVVAYANEQKKDIRWGTLVRTYYTSLLAGTVLSATLRRQMDEETKDLVRQWVREACEETGFKFPTKKPR